MKVRQWIARHVLRIDAVVYQLPMRGPYNIDKDEDYRATGKTTMRVKAAINHVKNTNGADVLFMVSTHHNIRYVEMMLREMNEEAAKKVRVRSMHEKTIRFRPTKIIHDLHEV